jgi:hypothetical protein
VPKPRPTGIARGKTQPEFFTLRKIHRQAAGSQPLRVATAVRKGGSVRAGRFDLDEFVEADVVICAMNKTRRKINQMIRRARVVEPPR